MPEAIGRRQEAIGRRQEAGGNRQEAGGRRQEAGGYLDLNMVPQFSRMNNFM